MTLTFSLPARELSPNARIDPRKKSPITKKHRERAYMITLCALKGEPAPPFTGYALAFYFKQPAKRDDDNAKATCKAYRDGIADALRIDDHTLTERGATFGLDPKNPRLEITLIP